MMGSGRGSSYSGSGNGGSSGSQPYAPTYHVTSNMLAQDKQDSDIYNPKTGYFKNPTATDLSNAIEGNRIVFNGKSIDGHFTYVMDTNGNIVFGKRQNPNNTSKRCPHPTLIGGKDPEVQCAGIIHFHKGRIVSVDERSGHFKPNSKSLDKVDSVLSKLYKKNPDIFDRDSKWRKNK